MSNETDIKSEKIEDGDKVANESKNDVETTTDVETKDREGKPRSVSFNRDVHVKRFGKAREPRGSSSEPPIIRKEPFTHLSEQELIDEANKVIAQAQSVTCTADHPPEKFFSLPHRKKLRDKEKRNSDDESSEIYRKTPVGRSISDVTSKRRKERTSLSTLFRRGQKNKNPNVSPIVGHDKSTSVIQRSKSDVSDLKSRPTLNTQIKPIRKRSGSESEEFLKSLRNKKTQLSPIIESSPREDYFQKISPLDILQKGTLHKEDKPTKSSETLSTVDNSVVNPVEKPPRLKILDNQEPKAPLRSNKSKAAKKDIIPPITNTPKRFIVDEIDSVKVKEKPEIKDKIKNQIKKIENNIYGVKDMVHSSQQPPSKPPLTRGHTVDPIVKILKDELKTPAPKLFLITNKNGVNQPFSYTRQTTNSDPNLCVKNTSPERTASSIKKMDRRDLYAEVIRDRDRSKNIKTVFKREYLANDNSDEDEGLGYEDRYKYLNDLKYDSTSRNKDNFNGYEGFKITDSPIKPRYREYKLTSFIDFEPEPTYANDDSIPQNYIDSYRGRGDGMDTKGKVKDVENFNTDFNELSHRRELLESRLNARRVDRDRYFEPQVSRYIKETDPIYEANNRMKATEKYVNETAKYYRHTLERDGYSESIVTEDFDQYDSEQHKFKYNTDSRVLQKVPKENLDRREFINTLNRSKYIREEERKVFPPEPEYEPPSLEFNSGKPILSPDEYQEKKYRAKRQMASSHEVLQSGQKYKIKDEYFNKRKGHYASNPEIAQEREDEYENLRYNAKHAKSYHNSLRRTKNKEKYEEDLQIKRHDSPDSRDYYRGSRSPRRYDIDSRLVDSGIENDFRKDSTGEINRFRYRKDSDDDVRDTSLFLESERKHAEDSYPNEQLYMNGKYLAHLEAFRAETKEHSSKEGSGESGLHLDSKNNGYNKSSSSRDGNIRAKPPKIKKLSGLEKVKQLFSRDSSKKSKKEKEVTQPKSRTRVLKSPEHLVDDDPDYRRYTDPEPSDNDIRKKEYVPSVSEERRYRRSREDLNGYRSSDPRDSDPERKYRDYDIDSRYERKTREERRYTMRNQEKRRYNSSDRESDHHRISESESDMRKPRSKTVGPLDSPALAERYRERRRLATPSPSPPPAAPSRWFKSLDRLTKKREKSAKVEKDSIITTEDESTRNSYKPTKPINSPAKNLRFFGDTDLESDSTVKQTINKTKSHPHAKSTLRKTHSNSSTGIDEVDHSELSNKSYSLTNLRERESESPRTKQLYRRNLHNISEIQNNTENEGHLERKVNMKPPISPYERRSRSHSSSKTLKASKNDVRRHERDSPSDLRGSKLEINRNVRSRRRTPGTNSGESSTEGDSSHQSQRSVVYLHATTVGEIPDPGRISRNRSRDDLSSVNSSSLQVKSTTKGFSLLAPWTPKLHQDRHDVHYTQTPRKQKGGTFKKSSSTKNLSDDKPSTLQKNKSYSQTTLTRRPHNSRLTSSSSTLYRKPEKRPESTGITMSRRSGRKCQSSDILNGSSDSERVSRSISMPKDSNKKAGWFKLTNKNKKQDINTRVR